MARFLVKEIYVVFESFCIETWAHILSYLSIAFSLFLLKLAIFISPKFETIGVDVRWEKELKLEQLGEELEELEEKNEDGILTLLLISSKYSLIVLPWSFWSKKGGIDWCVFQSPSTYHPEDLLGKEKKKYGFHKSS
jgi:hypothetical protein